MLDPDPDPGSALEYYGSETREKTIFRLKTTRKKWPTYQDLFRELESQSQEKARPVDGMELEYVFAFKKTKLR